MNNTPTTGSSRQRKPRRSLIIFVALLGCAVVGIIALIEVARRASTTKPDAPAAQTFAASDAFPRRLTDASGRTLVIPERPQRIASQTIGTDEILLAIGDSARIARLSPLAFDERYSNITNEARAANIPAAQNAEEILTANPDLVFVASYSRAETVKLLEATGAPVFRLDSFNSFDDIKENIYIVGYLTGEDERAAALVREMETQLAAIARRIPPQRRAGNRPRILSYGASGESAGAHTLFDDIARAAGATNITAEAGFDGFPQISAEQVARWNPDFIIASAASGNAELTRTRLLANPALAATDAGREGRIIVIDSRTYLAVSHHITKAVDALARGIYDERVTGDR